MDLMKSLPQRKNKYILSSIMMYFIIACLIVGSGDSAIGEWNITTIFMFVLLAMIPLLIMIFKKNKVSKSSLYLLFVMISLMLLTMLFSWSIQGETMLFLTFIALFTTSAINEEQFNHIFDNLVIFISVFSIVCTAIYYFFPGVLGYFPTFPLAGTSAYNLFVSIIVPENEELGIPFRNYGIFREPAMFCIYLGIASSHILFSQDKRKWLKLFPILGAMLLTKSITGYIAFAFLYGFYFLFRSKLIEKIVCVMTIVPSFVIVNMRYNFLNYIFERFDPNGASAVSMYSRYYSILYGIIIGLEKPLWGYGPEESIKRFSEIALYYGKNDSCWTNMITYYFASYGIFFTIICLAGLYCYGEGITKKMDRWVQFIFLLLLLCGETMTYSSLIFILIFYGINRLYISNQQSLRKVEKTNNV